MNVPGAVDYNDALQQVMSSDKFRNVIEDESKETDYLPIILVTNERVSENMDLTMFSKKVIICDYKENSPLIKDGRPYLSVEKAKFKKRTQELDLVMVYNKAKILITLKKKGAGWSMVSFERKKRKNFSFGWNF
ncbi:hypothetical protein ACJD0Z_11545 [Flavobacteriaceae bacterium M23B6Z8]